MMTAQEKVSAQHLARMAYLHVRQSTLRQVFDPLQKGEDLSFLQKGSTSG